MSETASRSRQARQQPAVPAAAGVGLAAQPAGPRQRRRRVVAGVAAGVVLLGAAGAWRAGLFSSPAASSGGEQAATATAAVVRESLSATTPMAATLGYAGSYTVSGQGGAALTELPQPGQVIGQGQALYQTGNRSPVVLLYGSVPDWRPMSEGTTGADVSQLNHDLVTLGDATSSQISPLGWDNYSWETTYGVQQLEEHLGVSSPSGSLALGQAVFEPTAIRVSQVTGSLGAPASGPVLQVTSDEHVVTVALDTSQESEVKAGDRVSVTLPDGTSTPGMVSSVGTVATTSSTQGATTTTVPVTVKLTHPVAAGWLDQAPVTVYLTTATAPGVLAVPVTALLARSPGGYVVEVIGPRGTRRYVPVTAGPVFDDNSGMVQVTGNLAPGQRVVVASS